MPDLLMVLLVLLVVLAIVTLVGHGIWVLLAALANAANGRKKRTELCVFCGRSTSAGYDRCEWCGKDLASPLAKELSDLKAVRRQLRRFRDKGTLKPEVVDRFLGRLEQYHQQLLHPAPKKREAPPLAAVILEEAERERAAATEAPPPAKKELAGEIAAAAVAPLPESSPAEEIYSVALDPLPRRLAPSNEAAVQTAAQAAKPEASAVPPATPLLSPFPGRRSLLQSPPPPSRSWTEMLAAFMEQRNIRWGELIGGLLFVCSSVALVVSLWETIEQIPYSKFFIFVSISSSVFGVGLYAHHRWKLESTSRALLVIATLLVPLNFVAMASMAKGEWPLLTLVSEVVSLAIFACLVGLAMRILVPDGRWPAVAAVLGDSLAVLATAQLVRAGSPAWLMIAAGAVPVTLFAGAVGSYLYCRFEGSPEGARWRPLRLTDTQIGFLFTLLGITAFSTLVALGLVVVQAIKPLGAVHTIAMDDVVIVLQRLSVLFAMAGAASLAGGLTVMRGSRRDKDLAAYHLAGTIVALVAMAAMLAALAAAWPAPGWLMAVAVLNTTALALAAFRWRLPVLHAGAIACAAVAYLIGFYLLVGKLPLPGDDPNGLEMLRLMIGAQSGTALAGLFVALAAVSELLARVGRRRHAAIYFGGCVVVAAVGLLLVTVHGARSGGADALRAAILYAVYGAGCLALTARWRRLGLTYLGLVLLASAVLWGLWWRVHRVEPLWGATLAIESLVMAAVAAVLQRYKPGAWHDPWKMAAIGQQGVNVCRPRSKGLSLADMYRIPLAHVGEAAAMFAAAVTGWTAWRDAAIILHSPTPAPLVASAAIAAVYFLLAWSYRSPQRTWAASSLALAGTIHALNYNYFPCVDYIGPNWAIGLLGHATAATAGAWLLDRLRSAGEAVRRVIGDPLAGSALLSSVAAAPALVFGRSAGSLWLACCFPWLAAVWLMLARRNRSRTLFAAHQLALAFAALAATTVWLKHAGWVVPLKLPPAPNLLERIASVSRAILEPWNLQAYGVALGVLSLAWVIARIIDLRWGTAAERLLQRRFSVDWFIRHGIVAMQWLVLAACALAEAPRELIAGGALPAEAAASPGAFGPTAWILLGVLLALLVVSLWERWGSAELVSLLLAASALPLLIAGRFATDLAVASALRWALAIGFAVCSIAVWQRERLVEACRRLRAGPFAPGAPALPVAGPQIARGILLATMALPVLAITVMAATLQIGGIPPAGPLAKTFFQAIGPMWSHLAPMALVIAALVGHALRERSSGYAFSAGLVLEMAVGLGYALHVSLAGRPFDTAFAARLIQLVAATAAAWAILWLLARKRLDVWREAPATGVSSGMWSRGLMTVQIGIALAANALVLGAALLDLSLVPVRWQSWSVEGGTPLGWIALAALLAAVRLRGRMRPHAIGASGMALLGLLACTIRGLQPCWGLRVDPVWGYRALMLGWAVYALLVVAATWWIASRQAAAAIGGSSQGLIRAAAVWVRVAGMLAVALGLQAAFSETQEQLWAAAAIAIASGAGAAMAVWQRREGWAFAAALGVNLAASLVVWHFDLLRQLSFDEYWLRIVQANVIASAAVAMVWLAARKRLYEPEELTFRGSRLLAIQVFLPVVGNCLLLVQPVMWIVHAPDSLAAWMYGLAAPQGWAGLLLAAAAAAWYLHQVGAGKLFHVLGSLALGGGVLAACAAASMYRDAPIASWTAYHVLTTAWAAAGLIVFAVGLAADDLGARNLLGPRRLIQPWAAVIGMLTVAVATLHAFQDPARPWWAAGAILTVSLTMGLVALLLRKPAEVYVSGLLINLAGTMVWWAYSASAAQWPDWNLADATSLVQANALCLALGSIVWSLLEFLPSGVPSSKTAGQELFAHLAAQAGAVGIGLVTLAGVFATLFGQWHLPVVPLDWIALGSVVAATAVCLLDRRARFPLPTLYCLGLSAVGMGLLARQLTPRMFYWSAVDELAAYALAAALIGWALQNSTHAMRKQLFRTGCLLQAIVVDMAGTLALWVAIDFGFDGCCYQENLHWGLAGRMAAVPALLFLTLATIVMAAVARRKWRARWQYATLTLGVLVMSGAGWAMLPANSPAPWLQRTAIAMVAATAAALASGFGLKRILPAGSDWRPRVERTVVVFFGLAIGMLVAVLAQEWLLFELPDGAPMVLPGIAAMIAAVVGLIGGCLAFAVMQGADPLRLSDRGRQAYVYTAEVLAAAVGLHVWLTMPWIFKGYLVDYWMLIVMAVAFVGAGLGEWFHRRNLAVLSQPLAQTALLLPLLPAIGFWIAPMLEADGPWHVVGRAPAVWFLMALFYGVLAVSRRSWKCAAMAVLAANLGLWVGLDLSGFVFLRNPQIFVIPLALAGLVAEYINHDRLSEAQSAAFRYLALSAIYVSSTADMFIAGLGNSWSLPLVLMLLSVAGMLAGILFRVRSFLFLGLTFLVLDAMSMIWYAAHDLQYTWVWYVCGITLGAAILAMFAVFEKRRSDILAAVEQLQGWAK